MTNNKAKAETSSVSKKKEIKKLFEDLHKKSKKQANELMNEIAIDVFNFRTSDEIKECAVDKIIQLEMLDKKYYAKYKRYPEFTVVHNLVDNSMIIALRTTDGVYMAGANNRIDGIIIIDNFLNEINFFK